MIYLSFRFSFTVGGEGAAMLWGVGTGATIAGGLMEGVKENAEGADGVSDGGLEAKEKPEDPDPKGVDPPRENTEGAEVAHVVGTEKLKPDDEADDDGGAAGTMLNGAAAVEAAGGGAGEAAAGVRPRFGNVAGADGMEAAYLGGGAAKEPANRKYIFI